jgi:hypothetical protein
MKRTITMFLLAVLGVLALAACGAPEVKTGPTIRDRANESFQDLEREESKQAPQ